MNLPFQYAEQAKKSKEKIDGVIILEMVGYRCLQPGCQEYPFPLGFFGYHLPSDTLETLDFAFMAELVESLVRFFTAQK